VNRIIVSGNLVRDAEMRYTPQGTAVVEFRIGVRDDLLKKREDRSVFLDIVLFGQRAEALYKYLLKGKSVLIEGRLDVKTNKTQDGRTFTNVQVYANTLEFISKKGEVAEEEIIVEEPSIESETPEEEISPESQ